MRRPSGQNPVPHARRMAPASMRSWYNYRERRRCTTRRSVASCTALQPKEGNRRCEGSMTSSGVRNAAGRCSVSHQVESRASGPFQPVGTQVPLGISAFVLRSRPGTASINSESVELAEKGQDPHFPHAVLSTCGGKWMEGTNEPRRGQPESMDRKVAAARRQQPPCHVAHSWRRKMPHC